jgi:hypothetical protein
MRFPNFYHLILRSEVCTIFFMRSMCCRLEYFYGDVRVSFGYAVRRCYDTI